MRCADLPAVPSSVIVLAMAGRAAQVPAELSAVSLGAAP